MPTEHAGTLRCQLSWLDLSCTQIIDIRIICAVGIPIFLLFVLAPSAHAESPLYDQVGSWQIRVDTTVGNGCFALAGFEGDTALRIGFLPDYAQGMILFGNPKWRSLEEGKEYPLEVQFGDEIPWIGSATAVNLDESDEMVFLMLVLDLEQMPVLMREFQRKLFVTAKYEGSEILRLSLNDSYKAGEKMLQCQRLFLQKSGDPFSTSPESQQDPFSSPNLPSSDDPFAGV